VAEPLLQIGSRPLGVPLLPSAERSRLERRVKQFGWGGNAWHLVEFAIALVAGSVALVGFGIDSLIELAAGGVIVWLFSGGRDSSQRAERLAQQLIAASYFVLAVYVGVQSLRDLVGGQHPSASWVGIGLVAFTAPAMPLLARAKRRLGRQLSSSATSAKHSRISSARTCRSRSSWACC
jgi:divalent metal cation (Fe/Co/Zn/Cd) transporter